MENTIEKHNEEVLNANLKAVTNQKLRFRKKPNEDQVQQFQNMQTCFFLSLALPSFFAKMMLPMMHGEGKKDIRSIITTLGKASKLYQLNNSFFELKDLTEKDREKMSPEEIKKHEYQVQNHENWLDAEDEFSEVLRRFASAVVTGRVGLFIETISSFPKIDQKEPTDRRKVELINERISFLDKEKKELAKHKRELIKKLNL